jgi:hypothetical protein
LVSAGEYAVSGNFHRLFQQGIHVLPIYSGGLGNVAGDQLKAASDLGVPVVGIGLLYQQGYFRQVIDQNGAQQALYPYNDPGQLPIAPLRRANGDWLRLHLKLPGHAIWLRAWQVQVGRAKLYLLDSNDAANYPADRGITSASCKSLFLASVGGDCSAHSVSSQKFAISTKATLHSLCSSERTASWLPTDSPLRLR